MSDTVKLTGLWLGLVLLTVASVRAAEVVAWQGVHLVLIGLALAKAWLIIDGFMELRHGPRAWRWMLMCWPIVMAVALLLATWVRRG